MIGVRPGNVAVTAVGHGDHPAYGGIFLELIPGVSDLIVLNDDSGLRLDIRASGLGTVTQILDGSSGRC